MIISLPDIRESSRRVVQGFIVQLYVGEDLRVKEEGVDIKPEPQSKRGRL